MLQRVAMALLHHLLRLLILTLGEEHSPQPEHGPYSLTACTSSVDYAPGLKCLRLTDAHTLQDLLMLPWSCGEPVQAELVLSGNNQLDSFLRPAQPSCSAPDQEQRSSDFSYSGIHVQNFLPRPPRFHFSSQSSWQQLPSPGSQGSCISTLLCMLFAKGFGVKSFSQGFFFFFF